MKLSTGEGSRARHSGSKALSREKGARWICAADAQVAARGAVRGRVPQASEDVQRWPPPQDRAEVPAARAGRHAG